MFQQQRNLFEFMRRLLVKRFESSFGAFAKSVENFIRVHSKVLKFIEKTGKYILDRSLIEKIWKEDEETIEKALQDFVQEKLEQGKFNPRHDRVYVIEDFDEPEHFMKDIRTDLELFIHIEKRFRELSLVEKDPKSRRLTEAVRKILETSDANGEPRRKVVIFSEYADTVEHIAPILETVFPKRVLKTDGLYSKSFFDNLYSNFDAAFPQENQRDDFDILITTDKLSEGVNLNRAGAVINYDIPWNPTRVIQRLGRINRIGRKVFRSLFIYNFFPTEQGAEYVKSREIAAQKCF